MSMDIGLLIVDDDKILVDKLEETIDWEKIGISSVFTAYNIRQAKEIFSAVPIQLMLCDIDMPQGSGLELFEWMRQEDMDTECVFLSSYANFAYAQKALRLSAREYLLKPISNDDLEKVLANVVQQMQKEKNLQGCTQMKCGVEEAWRNLLMGDNTVDLYKYYSCEHTFILSLAKIYVSDSRKACRKKLQLAKARLQADNMECIVTINDDELVMVEKYNSFTDALEKSNKRALYLAEMTGNPVCIYLSSAFNASVVREEWNLLRGSIDLLLARRNGVVIKEQQLEKWEVDQICCWQNLETMMRTQEGIQKAFKEIKDSLKILLRASNSRRLGQQFVRRFNRLLLQYLFHSHLELDDVFDKVDFEMREREAFLFWEGCDEFVDYIFETITSHTDNNRKQKNSMEIMREYIDNHLDQEISRNVLAQEVFLSEDYISKLFKSEMGISFPNYLAMRRIEKAKALLKESSLSISKIALKVGYTNFSYFSKTFKEITGMTPNEFRNDKKQYWK